MVIHLPTAVKQALDALHAAGYEAFVVGGCVRDALSGRKPKDWDITTSALPEQIQMVFSAQTVIPTGIRHGTVTVLWDGSPLEITTYRVDGVYSDGRHPDNVVFSRSLQEDLRRRDFTVNAMAYDPVSGLIDPFGGQEDLAQERLRCVGDATARFSEDALRILRALRFASTLGFAIEDATDAALRQLAPTLSKVSAERITAELKQLLCGDHCAAVLMRYAAVLDPFLPLPHPRQAATVVTAVAAEFPLRMAAVLTAASLSEAAAQPVLEHLRLDNHTRQTVSVLLRRQSEPLPVTDVDIKRLLGALGVDRTDQLLSLRQALSPALADDVSAIRRRIDALVQAGACFSLQDLAINGEDLISLGFPPGKEVGRMLEQLLEAVITDACPNQHEALAALATEHRRT